jgi:FixJ family two-component response regulator
LAFGPPNHPACKPKYDFTIASRKPTFDGAVLQAPSRPKEIVVLPTPAVISVIDDDASIRAAANNLLRSRGYIVYTFASAEEFLHSAHLNESCCVIADVQMSPMNGLELLTNMRACGHTAPFIFITAFPDENVRSRALKAGAVGFLAKPFAVTNLLKCLETALGNGRAQEES